VGESDVEPAALRPTPERTEAGPERAELAEPRSAAVPADHLRGDAVELEELQGLSVVAGRHLDLVPVATK
jgi:hypothetical protein